MQQSNKLLSFSVDSYSEAHATPNSGLHTFLLVKHAPKRKQCITIYSDLVLS